MSEPKSNRLRRTLLGVPGQDYNPRRGGVGSDLQWAGGIQIMGTSNSATPGQMGPGRQASKAGGAPVGAAIPDVAEHGSGVPSGSSNPAAVDPSMRFGVDSHNQPLTAASAPPRTTKHVAPFWLRAGHGNGEE